LAGARRAGRIGPRSYQQSHERLVDAVARLGAFSERARATKKSSTSATRKRARPASERGWAAPKRGLRPPGKGGEKALELPGTEAVESSPRRVVPCSPRAASRWNPQRLCRL